MHKQDPDNYYKLNRPFNTPEKANEAIGAFYEAVSELRNKHEIPDVLIVIKGSAIYEDGKAGEFLNLLQFGNQLNGVPMAAYAYGKLQAENIEIVNKLMK